MVKKIFLMLLMLLVLYLGIEFFREYMLMHPYYAQFLSGEGKWQHIQVVFLGIACALIPVSYLLKAKKKSLLWLFLALWCGLRLFQSAYVGIKSDLLGGAVFKTLINTGFLLGLGVLTCMALVSLGYWVNKQLFRLEDKSMIIQFLVSFGLGLGAFILIEYVLLILNLAYPLVNRLLVLGGLYLLWIQRQTLGTMREELSDQLFPRVDLFQHHIGNAIIGCLLLPFVFALFSTGSATRGWLIAILAILLIGSRLYLGITEQKWGEKSLFSLDGLFGVLLCILLVLTVRYFFNGFVLSFIPYPTAWDANHAYMFMPKMWALHHGYYRNEPSMMGFGGLWMPFIAYRFSLFSRSNGFLGISADTIAINMNFWSGMYVLFFGLGLVWVMVAFLKNHLDDTEKMPKWSGQLIVFLGRFLLLQWTTSGMGAFLAFIDNKTDMGVLAMVILALLSGFLFLYHLPKTIAQEHNTDNSFIKWLVFSGCFFGFAALAKPTAMFDVMNFGLLLRGLWFGVIGVVGLTLLIMGFLSLIHMRGIDDYFAPAFGKTLAIFGVFGVGLDALLIWFRQKIHYFKYLLIWTVVVVGVLVGVKLLYYIPETIFYKNDRTPKEWMQTLLLASASEVEQQNNVLLAQAGSSIPPIATCSWAGEGITDTEALYAGLKPVVGNAYDEDVGRYIGYGWKGNPADLGRGVQPFINPRWARFFHDGCNGFSPFFLDVSDAKVLCEHEEDWRSFDATRLDAVQALLDPTGDAYQFIEEIRTSVGSATVQELTATHREELLALEGIMQGNTVRVVYEDGVQKVYFPYKYLNFFNISFNRSLQNLSSYYTDIGIVWLILLFMTVSGLFYALFCQYNEDHLKLITKPLLIIFVLSELITIFFFSYFEGNAMLATVWDVAHKVIMGVIMVTILMGIRVNQKNNFLLILHIVTLFGRLMWLLLGGGILRYAIGIIVWTILCFLVFVYYLLYRSDLLERTFVIVFLVLFLIFAGRQMSLNMLRIATQGGGGAFMWYKTTFGMTQELAVGPQGQLTPVSTIDSSYTSDEVFNLQFPHYNKFLRLANERSDDEGVLIAGTYARYFINNQTHIFADQFLTELSQWFSDNNVCRSYLRLQDKKLKYLAIDPNIGTVVQGAGNKGLFERFFARLNPVDGTIEQHGTFTMLAALARGGYIRYVSSNNIGAKYAFLLPDNAFGGMADDAFTVMRAKMAIARFFSTDQQLLGAIVSLADQRVKDGWFVEDLADMMGAEISPTVVQQIVQGGAVDPSVLTESEKRVIGQFFNLRQALAQNSPQYMQSLQQMVMGSLGAGNQIIVLELVE